MQKHITLAAALILMAILMSACSSKKIDAAETAAPPSSAQPAPAVSGSIDAQAARQNALAAAGVSDDQAVFTKVHLDYDDGRQEWEVEFVSGDSLYEYDINAADGTVLKNTVKAVRSTSGASCAISQAQAEEIALGVFGVPAGQATFTKIKLDNDDGLQVWEIEYISGNSEYEVEINANDGKVLESSSEILDID